MYNSTMPALFASSDIKPLSPGLELKHFWWFEPLIQVGIIVLACQTKRSLLSTVKISKDNTHIRGIMCLNFLQ